VLLVVITVVIVAIIVSVLYLLITQQGKWQLVLLFELSVVLSD
jgi:hypothetical protein